MLWFHKTFWHWINILHQNPSIIIGWLNLAWISNHLDLTRRSEWQKQIWIVLSPCELMLNGYWKTSYAKTVLSFLCSNLTQLHIKNLEMNVMDTLNTKMVRPVRMCEPEPKTPAKDAGNDHMTSINMFLCKNVGIKSICKKTKRLIWIIFSPF